MKHNEGAFEPKNTLVHYNMPDLISKRLKKQESCFRGLHSIAIAGAQDDDYVVPPVDKAACTEEVLDYIFPPQEWEENGQLWRQTISSDPVTSEGLANLSERLDQRLHEEQAKEDGIDAVRSKLYGQFFDEIIRMETVICGERGLLLGKIRDDHKYTMEVYRKLFESCMGYALRKSLQAEKRDRDESQCLNKLKDVNSELQREISEVKAKTEKLQIEVNEQREEEKRKHADSLAFLLEINEQMKAQLRTLIKPRKRNLTLTVESKKRK